MNFRLLGTNGFHLKAKAEKFTAEGSRCRQSLKYENLSSSFGRQKLQPKELSLDLGPGPKAKGEVLGTSLSLLHRTFTCFLTIKLITLSSSAHQNFTNRRKLFGAVSASRQVDKRRVFQGMNDVQRETILYFIYSLILFLCELRSFT